MVSVFHARMNDGRIALALGLFLTLALTVSYKATGQSSDATESDGPLAVYTVNYPLAWMAERIGGDAVDVHLPVPDGIDPAHWQPAPEAIVEYQGADLILLNGAGYASWVQYASLSPNKSVDTTRNLEDLFVSSGDTTHSHGPEGEHDHGAVASHTWLDPTIASRQADAVMRALTARGVGEEAVLQERLGSVQAALSELDEKLAALLDKRGDTRFLFSHPVYQYLDSRYGLDGHSVVWEPGEEPDQAQWQALSAEVDGHRSWIMLWEAEPLASTAEQLRALGIQPVVFAIGSTAPAEGDYMSVMEANLEHLSAAVE